MPYFDHSATTPVHPKVLELMMVTQKNFYGNPSSIHAQGRKSKSLIEKARFQIAKAIGAKSKQIIFTSGGSESNNQILHSILNTNKNHIITSAVEHLAILNVLKLLRERGIKNDSIDVDENGTVITDDLKKKITISTGIISIMLANNEIGTIQPIKTITSIAKKKSILTHTDAVQCFGKMGINVDELGVDFLSLSGHKFYGPKGGGIIYSRNKEFISPFLFGGNQESGLRAGTENVAIIAGMGLAAEIASSNIKKNADHILSLENHFKKELKNIYPQVIFNGNPKQKLPGLISVTFPRYKSDIIAAKLDRLGMAISNGAACGSGIVQPSHVLKSIGLSDNNNISTIRISFGNTNTHNEVKMLLDAFKSITSG